MYIVDVGIPIKHYKEGIGVEDIGGPTVSSGFGFGFRDTQFGRKTKAEAQELANEIVEYLHSSGLKTQDETGGSRTDLPYVSVYREGE